MIVMMPPVRTASSVLSIQLAGHLIGGGLVVAFVGVGVGFDVRAK